MDTQLLRDKSAGCKIEMPLGERSRFLSDLTKTRRPLLSGIIFRVIRRRNFTGFTLQPRMKKKKKEEEAGKREKENSDL